ncbi:MAG TPA: histidine phosphatase family protein [Thermoanaerobaculia bacterium]|nr:histidine phosphatase family protein [Thermoanaerobaculia bacterium]
MATTLFLVRHGQASFGAADYDVLSETGRRQARVAGEALRGRTGPVRSVVTGAMRRQRDTASTFLEAMGLDAPVAEDAAWNEFDHEEVLRIFEPRWADHTALHRDLVATGRPDAFERAFLAAVARWTGGAHDADYRETWPGFLARVDTALERLAGGPGGSVLVFTSGGPISAACRAHLAARDASGVFANAFRLANASVTTLEAGVDGLHLRAFNDHAHLTRIGGGLVTFR